MENQENVEAPSDPGEMYEAAANYWKSVKPDVNGMLGGFSELSNKDVADSRKFIKSLKTNKGVPTRKCLDCGSGIGRVAKLTLLPSFDTVDMIDVTAEFIDESEKYLGPTLNKRVGEKFVCGLQNFTPKPGYYDVVWIQWVSGHLTDSDLVAFLKRCRAGTVPEGAIVIKENISAVKDHDFDADDNSYTRSRDALLKVFSDAGLTVILEKKQAKWPYGMYDVLMFALQ